jgi:hypothetical protein
MLRDRDRGRRQLGLEYRADVIDLPPGGDSIGCASRPAAAVAAPALRALICGRAEAPEPSSRHQALVHRSVFDGKVSYSGSRRAIRLALAIIERDREFVDSPLEGDGKKLAVPRDRKGSFEPQLVPKGQTRLEGFDDRIISLYARGLSVREIPSNARIRQVLKNPAYAGAYVYGRRRRTPIGRRSASMKASASSARSRRAVTLRGPPRPRVSSPPPR